MGYHHCEPIDFLMGSDAFYFFMHNAHNYDKLIEKGVIIYVWKRKPYRKGMEGIFKEGRKDGEAVW